MSDKTITTTIKYGLLLLWAIGMIFGLGYGVGSSKAWHECHMIYSENFHAN